MVIGAVALIKAVNPNEVIWVELIKEIHMPVAETPLVERIARVLAGAAHSSNAEGSDPSAAHKVDQVWREHLSQAHAILHTLREPDQTMTAAGDAETWTRMVEAAITQGPRF